MIVIGNIIMLIGSILMVLSGYVKSAKKTILIQSAQIFLMGIGNLFLGGFSGAFSNFLGLFRNLLCYKDKFDKKFRIAFVIIQIVFGIIVNNLGIIGYAPILASVIYTISINTDDIKLKKVLIGTNILWLIYDFYIKSYTSSIFDVFCIISCIVCIWRIQKDKKEITKQ